MTDTDAMIVEHATCVEIDGTGVLLRGRSGSGKSDLALRLIDGGATLVADDYVSLNAEAGALRAAPPDNIAGVMEVRGIGLVALAHAGCCTVGLVVDLVAPAEIARLPEPDKADIAGVALERIELAPFEISAAAKVRLAVRVAREKIRRS